jgi:hypothetical protein
MMNDLELVKGTNRPNAPRLEKVDIACNADFMRGGQIFANFAAHMCVPGRSKVLE